MHSMPIFGSFDLILAGVIGLAILIAILASLPDLLRYIKLHSM
jgi:hypothetical protein